MNLKDPNVQRIIIAVLVVGTVSYLYFGTTLFPFCYPVRKAQLEQLEQEYSKLSVELEKARQMVDKLPQLEAEYERLHEQWESAQKLLPEEEEMPELLRKVTTAGNRAGIEFMLFQPGAAIVKTDYKEHPVKVRVRGGYHQLGIFLSRLANLDRIVNVSNLDVKSAQKAGRKAEPDERHSMVAEFTLSAHTLIPGGANNEAVNNEAVNAQQ
jgi:type IV pilus assembly protein PilO